MQEFAPRGEIRQPKWVNELMRGYWENTWFAFWAPDFIGSARRHSVKHQFLKPAAGLSGVDVTFRIGRHLVAAAQDSRPLTDSTISSVAVEHDDFRACSDIQKSLPLVRGECQIARERHVAFHPLLDEFTLDRKHLHPPVFPIGYINDPVVGTRIACTMLNC